MKKIFVDMLNNGWFTTIVNLSEYAKGRAYPLYISVTDESDCDLVIFQSFDDQIAFEEIFGNFRVTKRGHKVTKIFIIETEVTCERNSQRYFAQFDENTYVCDSEYTHLLILTFLNPLVINREMMLADKPIIFTKFGVVSAMACESFEPVFDDDY